MSCLKTIVESKNRILITGHINPDGDAIGAGVALLLGLKKSYPDKRVEFVLQDSVPRHIKFLKGTSQIKRLENREIENYELAIFVDSANPERTGRVRDIVDECYIVNIDHHISNTLYGDLNIVKDISSTSELIYDIFENDLKINIDTDMANALYLGIINDTGNFSHSNVTARTFEIASKLLKKGVNNNYIVNNFFKNRTIEKIKLLGEVFTNMIYLREEKLVYYHLTSKKISELGITNEDTEGVVEELLSYSESEISLFMKDEKNGKIKGSLRSKNDIDVNRIASLLKGGGHKKAAGFTTELSVNQIIEKIKESI